jgi:NH3-dependent NAD+ synthetase
MRERQAQIISTLSVQPEIDPAKEVEARVAFLRDYLVSSGASGFLLAVSGGQDSTLAGRLCQLAVEKLEREASAQSSSPCGCRTSCSATRKTGWERKIRHASRAEKLKARPVVREGRLLDDDWA